MSVLNRIAYYQGRRDEAPNQELARGLAASEDGAGIREIAENLWNPEPNVRSDCIKVLYEIGYLMPELVAPYVNDYMKLLASRNNRLVWGGMIAISTVATIAANEVGPCVDEIERAVAEGSVITVDAGVKTLARVAATSDERRGIIFPFMLEHLRTCRPGDVPRHAEMVVEAVTANEKEAFIAVLQARLPNATPAQASRLRKVVREAEAD